MLLSLTQIARAVQSAIPKNCGDIAVRTISTDTRSLQQDDLFLALSGENFDGHKFLKTAVEKGACAVVVDREIPDCPVPVLKVADTQFALGEIAQAWRDQCSARRIAIVGSRGKTTSKEMLSSILSGAGRTHATPGNCNNLIGLPLTLFALELDHDYAVLEMGMNEPGELSRLTEIAKPDMLLLLGIGSAHIGQFDSMEALIDAKAESVRALPPDTPIVYDADCANASGIVERWGAEHPQIPFSAESESTEVFARDIRFENAPSGESGYRFLLCLHDIQREVFLEAFGRFNVSNATAVAATALALGVDADSIVKGIESFSSAPLRSEVRNVGGVSLIRDCYNANPDSMREALNSLGDWSVESGRTFLVLGEMLELGSESEAAHSALGRQISEMHPDGVFLRGEAMKLTLPACRDHVTLAQWFCDNAALSQRLIEQVNPGDTVLFKGSRGNRLEEIANTLEDNLAKLSKSEDGQKEQN